MVGLAVVLVLVIFLLIAVSPSHAYADVKFKSVALGNFHSAAVTSDGSLYTWGRNDYGQLGDGTTTDCYTPVIIHVEAGSSEPVIKEATSILCKSYFLRTVENKKQSFSLGAAASSGAMLTYKSNKLKVKVSAKGKVTIAKGFIGKAKITIKASATSEYKAATRTVTIRVEYLGAIKLKSVTSPGTGKLKITWSAVYGADFYIVYPLSMTHLCICRMIIMA